jgi:branched-chain amino acid transport system ATP-binding protein
LVEQNFRFASKLADRNYVIEHGEVVKMVEKERLEENRKILETLLGV